ncbi:DUF7500 family protein [Salinigranum sp. GCM10025319]|uniref:DUF7500 family protein n=1 Tax=Salinigranum sp. GCM10025319 TaxID=3252687 RepID=UPI00361EFF85
MAPRGPNDEEGVIEPDDLDITNNEEVHELRDGQYVIATEGTSVDDLHTMDDELDDGSRTADPPADPRSALVDHLESMSTANGIVVAGRFDGEVDVHESTSDDPGAVFGDLLAWYARNVDEGTPTPEVLGILCLAADVRVRYPLRTVADLLAAHDLSPDDSIRDLVEAVRAEGLVLPPEDRDR